ncbi:MAG: endonuclease III [Candidatus Fermentibacteraceae bacterium]
MRTPAETVRLMTEYLGDMGEPAPLSGGDSPFSVLVGTVISLRTRDAVTQKVTKRLLQRVATPLELAGVPLGELEELLRPAGFFRVKARQLSEMARLLCERHGGVVPRSRDELTALPGVGGKTAAFVLGMAFGIPAVCVDVHVHRVSNRIGLLATRYPEQTEAELMRVFPREEWTGLNHVFVRFGQRVCLPARPRCSVCPLRGECEWNP